MAFHLHASARCAMNFLSCAVPGISELHFKVYLYGYNAGLLRSGEGANVASLGPLLLFFLRDTEAGGSLGTVSSKFPMGNKMILTLTWLWAWSEIILSYPKQLWYSQKQSKLKYSKQRGLLFLRLPLRAPAFSPIKDLDGAKITPWALSHDQTRTVIISLSIRFLKNCVHI